MAAKGTNGLSETKVADLPIPDKALEPSGAKSALVTSRKAELAVGIISVHPSVFV